MVRAKTALENKKGEGYVDTGVKIIIAVVVGAVILGGLYPSVCAQTPVLAEHSPVAAA